MEDAGRRAHGHDNDSLLLLEHKLTIKLPYTFEPGALGGGRANMAVADGSVYVATVDLPLVAKAVNSVNGGSVTAAAPAGEIEALSLSTGVVEWDTKVPSLPHPRGGDGSRTRRTGCPGKRGTPCGGGGRPPS